MKDQSSNKVVLSEEDFRLLSALTENVSAQGHKQEGTLTYEIARATVLPESKMPSDVVRLGARVKVKDVDSNREMQFSIVLPQFADVKQQKISVLTPMGSALIGLSVGDRIAWKMPAGIRNLEVLEAIFEPELES
jgi:regulator of nucleoside diphosphate kinase